MTNKRYVQFEFPYDDFAVKDNQTNEELWNPKVVDRLNEQDVRIKELESENKMLKTTISRNEAYIKRVTTKGKWSNTGDVE